MNPIENVWGNIVNVWEPAEERTRVQLQQHTHREWEVLRRTPQLIHNHVASVPNRLRAVHLEVLASLDADAFLNAITRFSRRRGTPERIRSDNGTNMVRAAKELKLAVKSWEQDDRLRGALLKADIDWVFNPPAAPYMGGVWERQIRTVKKVLQAIVGSQVLDDERLQTLFCEVEAIVNERPITPVPNTPNEPKALTPADLLHLSQKGNLPLGGRSRRNFRPGDLIIIAEANSPRNKWHLGRVMEIKAGENGLVRQAVVKTSTSTMLRPVTKLCSLEGAMERVDGVGQENELGIHT
ncbi:uncharacterized protein LOC121867073 [Homarus americanus]|uniref:uncharacterized protein LOC121867073 n=1 Tax=Homarus americanus TaxID=6706 RepID=UPI001C43B2F7|nr:uncharacterized protein LOC121867073 [Homarus americanus]